MYDASHYFSLLRLNEASLAFRTALALNIVDRMENRSFTLKELQDLLGFTYQAARTYFPLLELMEITEKTGDQYQTTERARHCLAEGIVTSRKPYFFMGPQEDTDALISLMKGKHPDGLPLYGSDHSGETMMDQPEIARQIAFGLASRARNFADPLAQVIAEQNSQLSSFADIGAGSPYLAQAVLEKIPALTNYQFVDRPNGMIYLKEMLTDLDMNASRYQFVEQDFFLGVPQADCYCLSNTAHDWKREEYRTIMNHIRSNISPNGFVCIHEPLLISEWSNREDWYRALWMACYALTLFKLCAGQGTCYTEQEHDSVLEPAGFQRIGHATPTCDGCTALFYQPI